MVSRKTDMVINMGQIRQLEFSGKLPILYVVELKPLPCHAVLHLPPFFYFLIPTPFPTVFFLPLSITLLSRIRGKTVIVEIYKKN